MTRGDWQRLLHIRTYYEDIEKILWETACNDIPKVLAFCERELNERQG